MKRKQFLLSAHAIDVGVMVLSLILFITLFLSSLQLQLENSYGTVEIQQTADYSYASVGDTGSIAIMLLASVSLSLFLFFIGDTVKLYMVRSKKHKHLLFRNVLTWVAFVVGLSICGLLLQEIYFFFVLIAFLKFLFYIIATLVVCVLLFGVLLVGKKAFWYKGADWKLQLKLWAVGSVTAGILISTTTKVGIALGLVIVMALYNYSLYAFTRRK